MPITRILQSISSIEIGKIGEILQKRSGEKATDPRLEIDSRHVSQSFTGPKKY